MRWLLAYIRRYWPLHLAMTLTVLLLTAYMAAVPLITAAAARQDLARRFGQATIAQSNLSLNGVAQAADIQALTAEVDELVVAQARIGHLKMRALPRGERADGSFRDLPFTEVFIDLWSFGDMPRLATLVSGRWPTPAEPGPGSFGRPPTVEVVAGEQAVAFLGLAEGDLFFPATGQFQAQLVGVVAIKDAADPLWWGDGNSLPFIARQRLGYNPDVNELTLSLILPTASMENFVTRDAEYRFLLDQEALALGDPETMARRFLMLQSLYSDERKELTTGLTELYGAHLRDVTQAQATLFLLLIQSILGALYTVGVLTLLLAEQSRGELGVLSSRGFTRWQITGRFALIGALNFGLIALPLGILLARLVVAARYDEAVSILPLSWYLAGAVAFFAWLALVAIVQRASRQNIIEWLQRRARAGQTSSWRQNLLFDGMIFAVGALIFWQLQQTRAVLTLNESNALFGQADPLLLLAPTILILALALLWRRLFGPLLSFAASVARRSEGFSLPVGLTRLARTPGIPAQIILLITVTAALTVFSYVFVASLERRQMELAHYLAGADYRLGLPLAEEAAAVQRAEILAGEAGLVATDAYRATAALIDQAGLRINGTLLAVDPQTLPAVARFPAGISQFSVGQIMGVLPPVDEAVAVVISNNRALLHLDIGDQIELQVGNQQANGVVSGIINEFPTLTGAFFLTNLAELQSQINIADVTILNGQNELWLDGAINEPLPGETTGGISRLAEAGELSASFAAGLVYQETITALRLNRNLLLFLSSLGFLLAQLFTARQRFAELAIMQALGAERRRLRWLLFGEGLLMLLFGLGMGVSSGYLLAWMMRPLLGQTLAGSLAVYGVGPLALGLSSLLLTSAILLASYGLALLLLHFLLNRLQLASSLRLVEE